MSIDAMKLALAAIEAMLEAINSPSLRQIPFDKNVQAMVALRAAIEHPRQWQGLTDEERNNLWRDVIGWGDPSHDDEDLMKAIEAKLKEKNT